MLVNTKAYEYEFKRTRRNESAQRIESNKQDKAQEHRRDETDNLIRSEWRRE